MAEPTQPPLITHRGGTSRTDVLTSYDPRTGEVVGKYPVLNSSDLKQAVRTARTAGKWWAHMSFGTRKRWLLDWKRDIVRRSDELVALLCEETGKPQADAMIEVMLAVENLDWAARNAARALDRRRLGATWLTRNQRATVGYLPLGVVGVLGPWHNPVSTPMGSIAYAMAAGNAVVFKPHELTTGVGVWLADSWSRLAPSQPVLRTVTGGAETATALCQMQVDKIACAGSDADARAATTACVQTMTPIIVEPGGKGSMVVHVDAKLTDAAEAAVFGAMADAGQIPTGIQRAYVAQSVYERFLELVVDHASTLRPGADRKASYGPMIRASQVDVVRKQVRDAVARGGRVALGGLDSIRDPYIEPIILTEVPEESIAITGEGIGPVLVVNKVASMDEAADRINAIGTDTAVAVFTRDIREIEAFAELLRVGVVTINSSTAYVGTPALPFGGVGEYGHGHRNGEQGLREFSRTLAITRKRYRTPVNLSTFDRRQRHLRAAGRIFRIRHRLRL
ncbi:aldehyde dehydrogenase family protein [Nocardia sp. 004]|uniref:aldehyde dehydrogenase family protein n=1 Tax=Nocardia sp. 004 TaxID=3385978 RepID=UPI0039A17964